MRLRAAVNLKLLVRQNWAFKSEEQYEFFRTLLYEYARAGRLKVFTCLLDVRNSI